MPFILTENQKTYVFGSNHHGQLGLGHFNNVNFPTELKLSDPLEWFVYISCKRHHSIGITNKNKTYVFGLNKDRQLGLNQDRSKDINIPTELKLLDPNEFFIFISCGESHTIGITNKYKTYVFGSNNYGQLGLGHTDGIDTPTELKLFDSHEWFTSISCGYGHTVGITNKHKAYIFGNNNSKRLGLDAIDAPIELKLFDSNEWFISLSCGNYHTMGITNKHKTYGFGSNVFSQLGLDHNKYMYIPTELKLFDPDEWFISISCGDYHTVGITNKKKTYGFGYNKDGQLGLGSGYKEDVSIPTELTPLDSNELFTSFLCGDNYTIGMTDKNKICIFNDNDHFQLDLNNTNIIILKEIILPNKPIRLANQTKTSYGDKMRLLWIAKIKNKKTLINRLPYEMIKEIIKFL